MVAVNAYGEAILAVYTEKSNAYFVMMEASAVKDAAEIAYSTIYAMVNGRTNGSDQRYIISLWDLYTGNITNSILGDDVYYQGSWGNSLDYNVLANTFIDFYAYTPADSDIDGAATIETEIKRLENSIKKAKDKIAVLKDTTTQEQLIERTKAEADGLQAQADALQVKVAALKARLDAAIAAATPAK